MEDDDDDVVVDGKQGQHGEQCLSQNFRHRETGEPQSPQAEGSVPRYLLQTHIRRDFRLCEFISCYNHFIKLSQISVKSSHTTLFSFSAFTLLNSIQKIIFSLQRLLQRPLAPLYPHQQAALYDTFYHNNDDDIRTLGKDLVGLLIYFHSMLFRSLINSPRLLRRMVTGSSQESPNSVRCKYVSRGGYKRPLELRNWERKCPNIYFWTSAHTRQYPAHYIKRLRYENQKLKTKLKTCSLIINQRRKEVPFLSRKITT